MGVGSKLGAMTVSVTSTTTAGKQIVPAISMTCASYNLTVMDNSDNIVLTDTITGSKTYSSLAVGTYTVALVGLNASGTPIGGGSSSVTIVGGQTTPVTVTVNETSGKGSLNVQMDWTANAFASPVITSTLAYGSGTPAPITWTLGTNSATYSNSALLNGWYILEADITNSGNSTVLAGFADLVRIVAGQATSGTETLVATATGSFTVNIVNNFYQEVTLGTNVPNGSTIILDDGASPVTITPTGLPAVLWYINGVAQGESASFTVTTDMFAENTTPRLDCIAFSANGTQAGSLVARDQAKHGHRGRGDHRHSDGKQL